MSNSRLFRALKVGKVTLQHRLVMAPLTRYRADDQHVPLPFVKEYYAQRAATKGTLLITEATFIAPEAGGYNNVPGIYSKEQIAAWKEVTDAVHEKGSFIFVQLWALGRVAGPDVLKADGYELKGASAIPAEGKSTPKEMTKEDIQSFIKKYAQAARNAVEAGFDGVELHGANGYLIDQFLQDRSNQRTDEYGGSVENRARFATEVVDAVVDAIGSDRVAIRFSPFSPFQSMKMDDPVPQFTYIVKQLRQRKLAYLHLVESRIAGNIDVEAPESLDFAINAWDNQSPVFIAGGFTPEIAKKTVDEEYKDKDIGIVFGRYWISTPDLPFRIQKGLPLTPYDRSKFYNVGAKEGYIDYPFSPEFTTATAA
ncbi:NADPH dehydrogenase [Xylariales sp. PMI_506]|nr:NADPH dehydrogenase [Xylariales sp. PMI_506]